MGDARDAPLLVDALLRPWFADDRTVQNATTKGAGDSCCGFTIHEYDTRALWQERFNRTHYGIVLRRHRDDLCDGRVDVYSP